ncbi:MAG: ThiF family adenylyltransferase [Ardenticatenales bacterium]|nr:ThiF family adenylyltransferase [Ardenticatenales bacterium]
MQLDLSRHLRVLLQPTQPLHICLVGVGGTGSALAQSLCRLAWHCQQKGTEVRLVFIDPDRVELKNVGRQLYCLPECGQLKAETMARRMGAAFGLAIRAIPEAVSAAQIRALWHLRGGSYFSAHSARAGTYLLVGAVDNHHARQQLAEVTAESSGAVWYLDCGNARSNGQVLLGNVAQAEHLRHVCADEMGLLAALPAPHLQAPALLAPDASPQPALSCAELTLREEQSLVINQMVASVAAQYVHDWLLRRELHAYGTDFSLEPPALVTHVLTENSLATLTERLGTPRPKRHKQKQAA